MSDLPDRQKRLRDLLLGKGDVPITDLFTAMRTETTPEYDSAPAQQRWLSPYITNLNRNLACEGLRVEPGALKSTYRLVALPPPT
jgi:hypothetical protein